MWAIKDSPGPKAAYRGGWYHFEPGYTTPSMLHLVSGVTKGSHRLITSIRARTDPSLSSDTTGDVCHIYA